MGIRVVIDTNVFVSSLRSKHGASFKLLSLIGSEKFDLNISVPLIFEYEDAAKRQARQTGLTYEDIDDILDYICKVATHRQIFFLWRPFLKDPKDDLVLELAVEASCNYIITHNIRDFVGTERFGLKIITPKEFLQVIGEIS
ncbi:MAG: putative toxin-antitoxin system toxin component, PIN family [Pyrinomonadaceae bacterium]